MNNKEKRIARKEAQIFLESARKTSKLRCIPKPSKDDFDLRQLRDGSRYQEIIDDVEEMQDLLKAAGLTLSDISTDEAELGRLKAASDRLNAPHRERLRREEADRIANMIGDDSV